MFYQEIYKVVILITLFGLIFNSCIYDDSIDEDSYKIVNTGDFQPYSDSISIYRFDRHPEDDDQIFISLEDFSFKNIFLTGLYAYNIKTNKLSLITPLKTFSFDCNRYNWIIFENYEDNQIWKVKTNGDSLQQVTSNYFLAQEPRWLNNGKIFSANVSNSGLSTYTAFFDLKGNQTDSINIISIEANKWNSKNQIAIECYSNPKYCISIYDVKGVLVNNLITSDQKEGISIGSWSNDEEWIYWSNNNGVYKTNLKSSKTITILDNQQSKSYFNPILSIEDNSLILKKHIRRNYDKNREIFLDYLIRLDINTKNEEIIIF